MQLIFAPDGLEAAYAWLEMMDEVQSFHSASNPVENAARIYWHHRPMAIGLKNLKEVGLWIQKNPHLSSSGSSCASTADS